jgi:hypothetical protein
MRKKWVVAIAIFLIAFSVVGNIIYYRYVQEEANVKYQWPSTQGTVLSYSELWSPDKDFYGNRKVSVEYTYELSGRKYSASQMWFFDEKVPKYSQGQTVKIYYDPLKQERSAIQPWALSTGMFIMRPWIFYGGILAAIIGLMIIIMTIRANTKTS